MKPFDLYKAKAGAKVCTRNGKPVRVLAFDAKGDHPLCGLIDHGFNETVDHWTEGGICTGSRTRDLFMADPKPVEFKQWVNISGRDNWYFNSKEEAEAYANLPRSFEFEAVAVEVTGSYIPKG